MKTTSSLVVAFFLGFSSCAIFAQTSAPTASTPITSGTQASISTVQAYQQEQQALSTEMSALFSQGATQQQIEAWQTQNAPRFAAQQALAQQMAAESALQPMPDMGQPNIPANASPTMKDFLANQAALINARAQIHNQLLSALPAEVTLDQVSQMQSQEMQLFQQQQAQQISNQQQQATTLAAESANTPIPVPSSASIPANATPQMQAFLNLRFQLMHDQIVMLNQNIGVDTQTRNQAIQQWMTQNATRMQQLQTLATNLTPATSN